MFIIYVIECSCGLLLYYICMTYSLAELARLTGLPYTSVVNRLYAAKFKAPMGEDALEYLRTHKVKQYNYAHSHTKKVSKRAYHSIYWSDYTNEDWEAEFKEWYEYYIQDYKATKATRLSELEVFKQHNLITQDEYTDVRDESVKLCQIFR